MTVERHYGAAGQPAGLLQRWLRGNGYTVAEGGQPFALRSLNDISTHSVLGDYQLFNSQAPSATRFDPELAVVAGPSGTYALTRDYPVLVRESDADEANPFLAQFQGSLDGVKLVGPMADGTVSQLSPYGRPWRALSHGTHPDLGVPLCWIVPRGQDWAYYKYYSGAAVQTLAGEVITFTGTSHNGTTVFSRLVDATSVANRLVLKDPGMYMINAAATCWGGDGASRGDTLQITILKDGIDTIAAAQRLHFVETDDGYGGYGSQHLTTKENLACSAIVSSNGETYVELVNDASVPMWASHVSVTVQQFQYMRDGVIFA